MKTIQASWGPPAKMPKLKSPSYRQDNDPEKYIDITQISRMLGSKRLSNHHLRTPDAKEIQKYPQESFSNNQIPEPKTLYKWEALSFKKKWENKNPNHFQNEWLRLKDINVLINGWDELNMQHMDQYNHKVPKWTRSPKKRVLHSIRNKWSTWLVHGVLTNSL